MPLLFSKENSGYLNWPTMITFLSTTNTAHNIRFFTQPPKYENEYEAHHPESA
jgi:hypothetical protein